MIIYIWCALDGVFDKGWRRWFWQEYGDNGQYAFALCLYPYEWGCKIYAKIV